MTTKPHVFPAILLPLALLVGADASAGQTADQRMLERGRYVVVTGGCNDCHTPGYPESGGKTPQSEWLTGSPVGFQGQWGTSYPANLRLTVQSMSEAQWLKEARAERRPPMPWFGLAAMTDADLRAMYRFIRGLGPKGAPAPAYVPPGQKVATPYIEFFPKNLPQQAAR